ncbi:hypothetical protein C8F01DRAFT_1372121 [Mycena amicta]|nr:hypothetical protein C8F01DRAFT_1372121 [Mycena amicta]
MDVSLRAKKKQSRPRASPGDPTRYGNLTTSPSGFPLVPPDADTASNCLTDRNHPTQNNVCPPPWRFTLLVLLLALFKIIKHIKQGTRQTIPRTAYFLLRYIIHRPGLTAHVHPSLHLSPSFIHRDFFINAVWKLYPGLCSIFVRAHSLVTVALDSSPSSDHVLAPIHLPSTFEAQSMDSNHPSSNSLVTGPGEHNLHQTVPRSEWPVQTATLHHRMAGNVDTHDVGAFFRAAQNVNISGGSFVSHVEQIIPERPPSDFRTIPFDDIDLQAELGAEDSGYLHRRWRDRSVRVVRTMYSAKVEGREMTAVLYEGDEQAKEDWMKEVKQMSSLRHPYLLQLYGIASSGRIHAAIYHGGLISMDHMLEYHQANPEMRAYIHIKLSAEFWGSVLFSLIRHSSVDEVVMWSMSYFFRTSTGRLCIAVNPSGEVTKFPPTTKLLVEQPWRSPAYLANLGSLVESAPIDQLHRYLKENIAFSSRYRWLRHKTMTLQPTLFTITSSGSYVALAMLTSDHGPLRLEVMDQTGWPGLPGRSTRLRNGWKRYSIGPEKAGQRVRLYNPKSQKMDTIWMSQASHIFNSLNIRDKFDSYFLAYGWPKVKFTVPEGAPNGYLFYSPIGLQLPKKPSQIFWSFDPLGREQLSWKEARARGFPKLILSNFVEAFQWDASVYEEIRAMHIAKGFDPDTQDVARHLGYPLFELVSDIKARERTARFLDEDWEDDGWTLADLFGVPATPAVFLDDGWEDDGWTLADLFASETQPRPLSDESTPLNTLGTLKNILHGSSLPRAELIVILLVALAVWIELSRAY